jgi:hypothetical protein
MFDYRTFLSYPLGIYTGYYVDNARPCPILSPIFQNALKIVSLSSSVKTEKHFSMPVLAYKHSDSGFRYGMTHILELLLRSPMFQ